MVFRIADRDATVYHRACFGAGADSELGGGDMHRRRFVDVEHTHGGSTDTFKRLYSASGWVLTVGGTEE